MRGSARISQKLHSRNFVTVAGKKMADSVDVAMTESEYQRTDEEAYTEDEQYYDDDNNPLRDRNKCKCPFILSFAFSFTFLGNK